MSSSLNAGAPPGIRLPPSLPVASNKTGSWPLSASTRAASQPATPPPTTRTFFFLQIGLNALSFSLPHCGLTAQLISEYVWIRPIQPSWQLIHGRIWLSSLRRILLTISGSASVGRPSEIMSQISLLRQSIAVSGLSTRPAMITGMFTCSFVILANSLYGAFSIYIGG